MDLKFTNPSYNILPKIISDLSKSSWIRSWLYRTTFPGKWDGSFSGGSWKINKFYFRENFRSHGTEPACFHHAYNHNLAELAHRTRWNIILLSTHLIISQKKNNPSSKNLSVFNWTNDLCKYLVCWGRKILYFCSFSLQALSTNYHSD